MEKRKQDIKKKISAESLAFQAMRKLHMDVFFKRLPSVWVYDVPQFLPNCTKDWVPSLMTLTILKLHMWTELSS